MKKKVLLLSMIMSLLIPCVVRAEGDSIDSNAIITSVDTTLEEIRDFNVVIPSINDANYQNIILDYESRYYNYSSYLNNNIANLSSTDKEVINNKLLQLANVLNSVSPLANSMNLINEVDAKEKITKDDEGLLISLVQSINDTLDYNIATEDYNLLNNRLAMANDLLNNLNNSNATSENEETIKKDENATIDTNSNESSESNESNESNNLEDSNVLNEEEVDNNQKFVNNNAPVNTDNMVKINLDGKEYDVIPEIIIGNNLSYYENTFRNIIMDVLEDKDVKGIKNKVKKEIKKSVIDGKTISVDFIIDFADVSDEENDLINSYIKDKYSVGVNYDISIVIKADDEIIGNITELSEEIIIILNIPEEILDYNREYSIINLHDGKINNIDVTKYNNQLIFTTNSFSLYTILYSDDKANDKELDLPEETIVSYNNVFETKAPEVNNSSIDSLAVVPNTDDDHYPSDGEIIVTPGKIAEHTDVQNQTNYKTLGYVLIGVVLTLCIATVVMTVHNKDDINFNDED